MSLFVVLEGHQHLVLNGISVAVCYCISSSNIRWKQISTLTAPLARSCLWLHAPSFFPDEFWGKFLVIRFVYLYIKIINPQLNFKSNRHKETSCVPIQKQHPFILLIFFLPLSCLQPRWQLSGMTEKAQWSPINVFLLSFLGSPRKNTCPSVLAARSRHVALRSSGQWNMGESVCHLQAWPLTPLVRPSTPTASPPSSM